MNQYLKPDINEYFNDLGPILNDIFITIFCIIQKMIFLFIRTYFSFDTTDQGIPSVLVFQTGSPNRKFQPEVLGWKIENSLTECRSEEFGKDITSWFVCNVPRPPNEENFKKTLKLKFQHINGP